MEARALDVIVRNNLLPLLFSERYSHTICTAGLYVDTYILLCVPNNNMDCYAYS